MATNFGFEPVITGEQYFISYNNQDSERIGAIARELHSMGIPMWYDKGILVGEEWEKQITLNIKNCKAVILFLTKALMMKENPYVQTEYNIALGYHKNVIIVYLDDVTFDDVIDNLKGWWFRLSKLHGIKLHNTTNPNEIAINIAHALGYTNEELKILEEQHRLKEQQRLNEQRKLADEQRIKEQKILEEEKRKREEQLRIEEEQRQREAKLKLEEEQRRREAQRLQDERLRLEEEQRQREERLKRLRLEEDKRKREERQRLEAEQRRYEELKRQSIKNFWNENKTTVVSVAVVLILISVVVSAIVLHQNEEEISHKNTASTTYGDSRDVILTLKCTYDEESLLKEVSSYFTKKYTDEHDDVNSVTINIEIVGDIYAEILNDINSTGDVFCTLGDSTKSLADKQVIYPMPKDVSDDIISLVGQSMANTTFYNGNYYGFPYAPNTAQVMYYNTSLYTEDDVKSLNVMLEKSLGNIKNFAMDSSSWNTSTWYLTTNAKLFTEGNKDICTFDSSECVEALKFVQANNSNILIGFYDNIVDCMKDGMIAAACGGDWNVNAYKDALGKNFGVEMLPKVTINGHTYQMTCFGGGKYYAVNAASKEPEIAIALAKYLASEEVQLKRYKINGTVPTALSLLDNEVIKSNPTTCAVMKQGEYIVPLESETIPGNWWNDSESLFKDIYSGTIKSEDIQSELTKHVESWKQMY